MQPPDPTADRSGRSLTLGVSLFACDHGRSGIGRFMRQIVPPMLEAGSAHRWHLWVAAEDLEVFAFLDGRRWPQVTAHAVPNRWNRPALSPLWHLALLPRELRRHGVDVLYLPAGNRRLAPFSGVPTVAVIHDLAPFHVRGKYDPFRQLYVTRVLPWMMRRTPRVIAISGATADDVVKLARYPAGRIHRIGNGYDPEMFYPREPEACLAGARAVFPELPQRFALYVSRLEHPGKNHVGLLSAYRRVLDADPAFPYDLVFAGSRWDRAEEIDRALDDLGLGERVHLLGFVSDDVLPLLLGAARALVFPSLFEGFGLPILEAQASGLPVACADTSSLPEVAGDGAILFDPRDPEAIARAIRQVLTDEGRRAGLRERGLVNAARHTWERAGRDTMALLEETANAG